jgi:hypothetical protein
MLLRPPKKIEGSPMQPRVPLRQALQDRSLLGQTLKGPSWQPWRTLLIASMGEELTPYERETFKAITGRDREPGQRVEELVAVVGRRGGKSRAISTLACYVAGLCNHGALVSGERGVLLIIAPDQTQADICLGYIVAAFEQSPMLKPLIEARTQRELRLTNKIDIQVRASDFRRLRGPTYVGIVCDEVAFWMNSETSANPDDEILASVRPGMATTNGLLVMISSPYSRRGVLWDTYRKHYGSNGDPLILVAKGSSKQFNPSLPQGVVDRAYERDAASASAEYGGEWRRDIDDYISLEVVSGCRVGIIERAPATSHVSNYVGFVDPSGGSQDAFALCVGHYESSKDTVIVDCLREVTPPLSPEQTVQDFSRTLKSYHINKIVGDRYAGQWPVELFAKFGITYEQSAAPKSDLYRDLLPLLNSRRVELLDNAKLVSQLCSLERRTARGGRDSIDHPPGGHDDLANVVAGLCSVAVGTPTFDYKAFNGTSKSEDDANAQWRRWRYQVFIETHGRVRI